MNLKTAWRVAQYILFGIGGAVLLAFAGVIITHPWGY
jgi:hypothetical protein